MWQKWLFSDFNNQISSLEILFGIISSRYQSLKLFYDKIFFFSIVSKKKNLRYLSLWFETYVLNSVLFGDKKTVFLVLISIWNPLACYQVLKSLLDNLCIHFELMFVHFMAMFLYSSLYVFSLNNEYLMKGIVSLCQAWSRKRPRSECKMSIEYFTEKK